MKSADIRERFLAYFERAGHRRVKSSSLIPAEDPSLLFTNAGMVQFKDCFLGVHDPGYRRATTAQKCVRAGGKHNDLENVGFTPRHHTFFEMLGNFSFGDYFKKEAISFAWDLLTREYGLSKDRLRVTVFEKDDEAFELWKAQGVRADWIVRLGEKDNFWAMGDTGPCGPCTEIHYDWGEKYGCGKPTCAPGCSCDARFLEIWNLVFMQFNRDVSGKLTPLPKPSVDTGSGLERMSAVLQGVYSNYDTDLFQPIIRAVSERVKIRYGGGNETDTSMRVISDHLRSASFLIADGVSPSNEGRGYVLRRILRRAIRHGKKLGQNKPFLHELVPHVVSSLGSVYTELSDRSTMVGQLIHEEENRFHETLHRGMGVLEEQIQRIRGGPSKVLPGDVAFRLYDSYGFPIDLTQVICAESGISVDEAVFSQKMDAQRAQSARSHDSDKAITHVAASLEGTTPSCRFVGYEKLTADGRITRMWDSTGKEIKRLVSESGFLLTDQTPFYAESGGQVGDRGSVAGSNATVSVVNVVKAAGVPVHAVQVEHGQLTVGDLVAMNVDGVLRKRTAINHTATHLLHAALRQVLGERVKQAGSLVEPSRLRFDFAFPRALTSDELDRIEKIVNEQVRRGLTVVTQEMPYDKAIQSGAFAFFDDKYGEKVRVVRVGTEDRAFSTELCGGTHLHNVTDIVFFRIISESSIASGVRRIAAIASDAALEHLRERDGVLSSVEERLGVTDAAVINKLDQLQTDVKQLRKDVERLQLSLARGNAGGAPWERKLQVRDLQLVMEKVPSGNPSILRTLADQIRDKLRERTVVVLATESDGKVSLCVGLTKDLIGRLDAGQIIKPLAMKVGGTGGGRPDFAQAGGNNPAALDEAFSELKGLLEARDIA